MLGAFAKKINIFRLALRAHLWYRLDRPAVVALQPVAMLVICHGDAAIRALHRSSATSAQHRPGVTSAIDQHQRLRSLRETFLNSGVERAADRIGLMRTLKIF